MYDLIIKNGQVVSESGIVATAIAVKVGRFAAIGDDVQSSAANHVIDAHGLVVLPGVVDGHVHFNEPGRTHWEGWECGTRGAAAGGVTTVLEMPLNASPPTITAAAFDAKCAAASRHSLVDFGLWGGMVDDNLVHLEELHERGVVAFKAFMCDSGIDDFPRVTEDVLAQGLDIIGRLGAVLGVHAENQELVAARTDRIRARGRQDRGAWCESRPPEVEWEAIDRFIECGRGCDASPAMHVVHVSTVEGLRGICDARDDDVAITLETCPHYLAFTERDFIRLGPTLKCAPPVRNEENRERLWDAVLDGRVDVIGSDHSPCPAADKTKGDDDIWLAWGGVSGIQATIPVLVSEGVHRRGLSWERLAELVATNPARRFGIYPQKGAIRVGSDADLTFVDPDRDWTFSAQELETRSGMSPYLGMRFRGAVVRTVVRGRTVFCEGEIAGDPGYGTLVRRTNRPIDEVPVPTP